MFAGSNAHCRLSSRLDTARTPAATATTVGSRRPEHHESRRRRLHVTRAMQMDPHRLGAGFIWPVTRSRYADNTQSSTPRSAYIHAMWIQIDHPLEVCQPG